MPANDYDETGTKLVYPTAELPPRTGDRSLLQVYMTPNAYAALKSDLGLQWGQAKNLTINGACRTTASAASLAELFESVYDKAQRERGTVGLTATIGAGHALGAPVELSFARMRNRLVCTYDKAVVADMR